MMACGREMSCLKEGVRSGRARFSQELAQASMVRMGLSKRPVEQVWLRWTTVLGGNLY
jgi:hypothetical protein